MGSSTSVIRNGDWEHQLCWVNEENHLEQRRHLAKLRELEEEVSARDKELVQGKKNPAYSRGNSELSASRDSYHLAEDEIAAKEELVMTEKDTFELVRMERRSEKRMEQ